MPAAGNLDWLYHLLGYTLAAAGLLLLLWALFWDRSRGRRRCPKCWYDMAGVPGLRCPECGNDAKQPARLHHTRRRRRLAAIGVFIFAIGFAGHLTSWVQSGAYTEWIPTRVLIHWIPSMNPTSKHLLGELDQRLAAPGDPRTMAAGLRRLAPMSAASRRALARAAITTLSADPTHPASQLLYELMPDYLDSSDAPKAQHVVLLAVGDSNPIVCLGALRTLRHVQGFNAGKATDAIISSLQTSLFTMRHALIIQETITFLEQVQPHTPRAGEGLMVLLSGQYRIVEGIGHEEFYPTTREVLWAFARLGPSAKDWADRVAGASDGGIYTMGLAWFARLMMEDNRSGGREAALLFLCQERDGVGRYFAATELGNGPPSEPVLTALGQLLTDRGWYTRVAAAESLIRLGHPEAATVVLRDELTKHSLFEIPVFIRAYATHGMDLTSVANRVHELNDGSVSGRRHAEWLLGCIDDARAGRPLRKQPRVWHGE